MLYKFLLYELERHGPETLQQASEHTQRFTIKQIMHAATRLELDGFIIRTVGGRYDVLPPDMQHLTDIHL